MKLAIFIISLLLCSANANAADMYLGLGLGGADADLNRAEGIAALGTANLGATESGDAVKAIVGYRANRFFAIESAYADLGKTGFKTSAASSALQEIKGVEASAVVFFPIAATADIFAKAGLFAWDRANVGSVNLRPTESGTDATYGVGIQSIRKITVRGEYQRFEKIDITLISVSVLVNF